MYQPANNRVVPDERAGFTLIELIVVVAILVLVSAAMVGVSSYLKTQKRVVLTKQCLQLLNSKIEFKINHFCKGATGYLAYGKYGGIATNLLIKVDKSWT